MTYEQAQEIFATARNKEAGKPVGHNTRLHLLDNGNYAIRFWNTNIVVIRKDGNYVLNSGGWRTMTTKDRINSFAPCLISQTNYIWYVYPSVDDAPNLDYNDPGYDEAWEAWREQRRATKYPLFEDGIVIDGTGTPEGWTPEQGARTHAFEKLKAKVDRLANTYVKGYIADVMRQGLQPATMGDCWGCLLVSQQEAEHRDYYGHDTPVVNNPPVNGIMGVSHLFEHFKEKYYVPSLLVKAIREQNYTDPGVIYYMINSDIQNQRESYHLEHALRRYFMKRKVQMTEYLMQEEELKKVA